MIEMLMSLMLAFGICFYAMPAIIHVSFKKKLFDIPDSRKVHQTPIPSLGGLSIYAGIITAFLLTVVFSGENFVFQYFVAASIIMFFIGLKDDLLVISPFKKFLAQLLSAALLVFKEGLVIDSMQGFVGIYHLDPLAANILSVLTIVVIINAFNLIDGIDGLAGSLSLVAGLLFAIFFAANGDYAYGCLATALIGAVSAFLIFNFPPARIFMGDTGSLIIGLIQSVLVIRFIQTAGTAPVLSFSAPAGLGFAILFVPLFDTLRVFSFRILNGRSPFTPDRNHIHHLLLKFNWSHLKITLVLSVVSMLIVGLAFLLQPLGNTVMLLLLNAIGFAIVGISWRLYNIRLRKEQDQSLPRIQPNAKKANVISVVHKKAAN